MVALMSRQIVTQRAMALPRPLSLVILTMSGKFRILPFSDFPLDISTIDHVYSNRDRTGQERAASSPYFALLG